MMTPKEKIVATLLAIALILLINTQTIAAQPQPQQYYGLTGGEITGYVLGNTTPLDWAIIHAMSNQHTYEAFSGMSGVYLMRVPVGTYNVTAYFPGYATSSANVTVTDNSSTTLTFHLTNSINVAVSAGSSSVINYYLEENQVPVPEFQPSFTLIILALMLAVTVMLRRSRSEHEPVRKSS